METIKVDAIKRFKSGIEFLINSKLFSSTELEIQKQNFKGYLSCMLDYNFITDAEHSKLITWKDEIFNNCANLISKKLKKVHFKNIISIGIVKFYKYDAVRLEKKFIDSMKPSEFCEEVSDAFKESELVLSIENVRLIVKSILREN